MGDFGIGEAITAILAAASATEGGLKLAGVGNPPSGPSPQQLQQMSSEQQQKTQQQQEQQLFKHFAPDAQAQTGGSLSDTSMASMIAELSGTPGDLNLAKETVFGGNNPGLASGGGP